MPLEMVYVSAVVLKPMPMAATAESALGKVPAIRISPSYSLRAASYVPLHPCTPHLPFLPTASIVAGWETPCTLLGRCTQGSECMGNTHENTSVACQDST